MKLGDLAQRQCMQVLECPHFIVHCKNKAMDIHKIVLHLTHLYILTF